MLYFMIKHISNENHEIMFLGSYFGYQDVTIYTFKNPIDYINTVTIISFLIDCAVNIGRRITNVLSMHKLKAGLVLCLDKSTIQK